MPFGIRLFLLVTWSFVAVGTAAQDVRVRVLGESAPESIVLEGESGSIQLFAGEFDDPLMQTAAGQEVVVSISNNQLHVESGEMGLFARSLRVVPIDGSEIGVHVQEGAATPEVRSYSGKLIVSAEPAAAELVLVNEVPLEEYVAAVVASEYGFDDMEGSKAMAVLARTYAFATTGKYGSEYDQVDNTRSQVYRGSGSITQTARDAARETRGEVLTFDGELVRAVYFSSSGGHTADNEDVWEGSPLPYLRGKSDPYGESSPHSRWSARISRPELLDRLSDAYDADVEGFVIGERSADGRVESIDLLLGSGAERTISGNDFRLLVIKHFGMRSLRSTLFDARREGSEYVFDGRGFGHGVGLSQWGAHEMAQRGMSYDEILDFYYTDVQLASLDSEESGPVKAVPVANRPEPDASVAPTRRIGW